MSKYNLKMIEETTSGDKEFMELLAKTFVEEVPRDVEAMNEAVENENAPLAYQIVHKMKPNLQMFGLNLSNEVEKLESWSQNNSTKNDILPYANKISETVHQAVQDLKSDFRLQ
ncbi:MAG TPA: Hpt domain-containing protein [Flavobacteriaceae bacterium]|nr:Hpt domain-containing protein [Flavobacteriaceae bacterium]